MAGSTGSDRSQPTLCQYRAPHRILVVGLARYTARIECRTLPEPPPGPPGLILPPDMGQPYHACGSTDARGSAPVGYAPITCEAPCLHTVFQPPRDKKSQIKKTVSCTVWYYCECAGHVTALSLSHSADFKFGPRGGEGRSAGRSASGAGTAAALRRVEVVHV
eukprot:2934612-Rhodomonas_salina.1